MEHFSDSEDKGQYCRFVKTADGSYILEPVKVPAHVKAEREKRIRQRDMRRRVEKNRERAQAINARSLVFMAFAISIFVVICCAFLYLQNRVTSRMDFIASLQTEVESLTEDNDTLEKRLQTTMNLDEIAAIAENEFGMSLAQSGQIQYYSDDEASDYMLQLEDVK